TGRIDASVGFFSLADGRLIREFEDPEKYGYLRGFGDSLAVLGDVNRDGVPDFAVGCEEHLDAGDSYDVTVVSGKDLAVLNVLESDRDFLVVAAAGDLDSDGVPDLLIGRWQRGIVKVYSGGTWKVLRAIERPSER